MTRHGVTLLFGATGQLGRELQARLPRVGRVVPISRAECDLMDPDAVRTVIHQVRPSVVVNAAAYTAVDDAEANPDLAQAINGSAPGIIAGESAAVGAMVIHYSSDYVFDGSKASPYSENDPTNPLCVYGRTKRDGEIAVEAANPKHLVFRASWVAGRHGKNFVKTIIRLAQTRDELSVVSDQVGTPTSAEFLASETARIAAVMLGAGAGDERWGLYHLSCAGQTSWHAYARYIVEELAARQVPLKALATDVRECSSELYAAPAKRPPYSVLSTKKASLAFGTTAPDWRDAIGRLIGELITTAMPGQGK